MRVSESQKGELTPKQVGAIEALLSEPTTTIAAKSAGVGEATLFRWLNDPDFSAAYRDARGRLLERALTILQASSTDAAECLRDIVRNKKAPVYARLSAAKTILEIGLKAREALEVEERLRALEERLNAVLRPDQINFKAKA
ncbi:MAG: hypothetical protein ACRD9Y_18180 [Blastocatellia bacterium]